MLAGVLSPPAGCLESREMLNIPLLPLPIPHAGKESLPREQGRGWQPPAQLSREKLSSDRISAKYFSASDS